MLWQRNFRPQLEYRDPRIPSGRSLRNPNSTGPDPVYAIAMDVGRVEDHDELKSECCSWGSRLRKGKLDAEPVRSQGHVHAVSPHCGWSTPELFEIWQGRAIIYGQEIPVMTPAGCVAIHAGRGDKVVIPPKWGPLRSYADVNFSKLDFWGCACGPGRTAFD